MTKQRCDKESVARELIRQDRARQLRSLKKDLIAAANQPMTSLDMTEVRKKGLLAFLQGIRPANSKPPTLH
jgi:hypothetical protein